jgi:hypothetical protein
MKLILNIFIQVQESNSMNELRLKWEPKNKTPLAIIEEHMKYYMSGKKQGGVTILSNGTLLFTRSGRNNVQDAENAMSEAKFLIDFGVTKMKDGPYLVEFHKAVSVFVGAEEFKIMRNEIIRRLEELKFPEEVFFQDNKDEPQDHLLIGLYARGKLQYDAYNFSIYKRLEGV